MNSHIVAVHEKRRPFECALCGKTFSDKRNMIRHFQSVHEKKKVYKYEQKCPLCKYTGRYKSELVTHMARMHQNTFFDANPNAENAKVENPNAENPNVENPNGEIPNVENPNVEDP